MAAEGGRRGGSAARRRARAAAAAAAAQRGEHDALVKAYTADRKAREARLANRAIADATAAAAAAAASGAGFAVLRADVGADGKLLRSVVQAVGKAHPALAVVVFSADAAAGRAVCLAQVPPAQAGRLRADEWVAAAVAAAGGRGGGKADSAQGQLDAAGIGAAVAAAEAFVARALAAA